MLWQKLQVLMGKIVEILKASEDYLYDLLFRR